MRLRSGEYSRSVWWTALGRMGGGEVSWSLLHPELKLHMYVEWRWTREADAAVAFSASPASPPLFFFSYKCIDCIFMTIDVQL